MSRGIGIISKLRYFIDYLHYTYTTNIQPHIRLQKKALRIMLFSKFDQHSEPLFIKKKGTLKRSFFTSYPHSHLSVQSQLTTSWL